MTRLIRDVRAAGGAIVVRDFAGRGECSRCRSDVVFNCTGLGAKALFDDPELVPVKGQLTVLLPQPEVTYNALFRGSYMFPRQDGVLLGGTEQKGDWSLSPDLAAEARIMRDQQTLNSYLRAGARTRSLAQSEARLIPGSLFRDSRFLLPRRDGAVIR